MKPLKNKKSFTPFTSFTVLSLLTPFTLSKQGKVNEGKRKPFTAIVCQPCWFKGKVNGVNGVTRKCDLGEVLGKRPKFTSFTLNPKASRPYTVMGADKLTANHQR